MLEVASGTGQHITHFARHVPSLSWQPSEHDDEQHPSINAWIEHEGLDNVLPPLHLDVTSEHWPVTQVDVIYNANMIHIAPWETCVGLLAGAGRHLADAGALILYGPYRIDGEHTAPSNASFDTSLRSRDSRWGVRDLEAVETEAHKHQLGLVERVPMPANNQILQFRRSGD